MQTQLWAKAKAAVRQTSKVLRGPQDGADDALLQQAAHGFAPALAATLLGAAKSLRALGFEAQQLVRVAKASDGAQRLCELQICAGELTACSLSPAQLVELATQPQLPTALFAAVLKERKRLKRHMLGGTALMQLLKSPLSVTQGLEALERTASSQNASASGAATVISLLLRRGSVAEFAAHDLALVPLLVSLPLWQGHLVALAQREDCRAIAEWAKREQGFLSRLKLTELGRGKVLLACRDADELAALKPHLELVRAKGQPLALSGRMLALAAPRKLCEALALIDQLAARTTKLSAARLVIALERQGGVSAASAFLTHIELALACGLTAKSMLQLLADAANDRQLATLPATVNQLEGLGFTVADQARILSYRDGMRRLAALLRHGARLQQLGLSVDRIVAQALHCTLWQHWERDVAGEALRLVA